MVNTDPFGMVRERKIIRSGARDVFTPHRPINSTELFFGRQDLVRRLVEQMNTPGQHAILYGERGVGKTSLAIVASQVLRELVGGQLHIKKCDSSDSFPTIVAIPLRKLGIDIDVIETEASKQTSGEASLGVAVAKIGAAGEKRTKETISGARTRANSPAWVAEKLAPVEALFIIDEADAISDVEDRKKLAELIKHLSDEGSSFKILVVGISETADHLTGGHPSVHRCLRETKLDRMTDSEIAVIVTQGADKLGLEIAEEAVTAIVELSAGYPHFAHLLALKCAEEAIGEDAWSISTDDLEGALSVAADDAEGTLQLQYDEASRSHQTDMYKNILTAAAECTLPEFTASELREELGELVGRDITQQRLNYYLRRLVSDTDSTVLRRMAIGIYRFNDPRMPSYIRITRGMI